MPERQMGESLNQIEQKHKERYEWAKNRCHGKTVADIACGVGYGSHIMADVAYYVYGYDRSHKAIAVANLKYDKKNIDFNVKDILSFFTVPTGTKPFIGYELDVIVALECIEHFPMSLEVTLSAFKESLSENGIIIFSHPENETSGNKYHLHKNIKGDDVKATLGRLGLKIFDEWMQPGNSRYDYHLYAVGV